MSIRRMMMLVALIAATAGCGSGQKPGGPGEKCPEGWEPAMSDQPGEQEPSCVKKATIYSSDPDDPPQPDAGTTAPP